jgi:predicted SAM-dependent methyltransferase
VRCLEIGPGHERLPGFETLNVVKTPITDHVGSAQKPPFPDASFDLVYSSHCIEHVEWFDVEATIAEWARILKPGGVLEVHTVNAVPLMRQLLEWEEGGDGPRAGTWRRDLHRDEPFLWGTGRLLNYNRKGSGTHWMHRAILTPRYMRQCFERAGLIDLEAAAEPRGAKKHKAVNMGLRGVKRCERCETAC